MTESLCFEQSIKKFNFSLDNCCKYVRICLYLSHMNTKQIKTKIAMISSQKIGFVSDLHIQILPNKSTIICTIMTFKQI